MNALPRRLAGAKPDDRLPLGIVAREMGVELDWLESLLFNQRIRLHRQGHFCSVQVSDLARALQGAAV
jgi:hypothetical protein